MRVFSDACQTAHSHKSETRMRHKNVASDVTWDSPWSALVRFYIGFTCKPESHDGSNGFGVHALLVLLTARRCQVLTTVPPCICSDHWRCTEEASGLRFKISSFTNTESSDWLKCKPNFLFVCYFQASQSICPHLPSWVQRTWFLRRPAKTSRWVKH